MQLFPYHIKSFWWLFILLSLTGTLLIAHVIAQQDQERFLEKYVHRNEPLRIKAIKGKKGTINISKKFLDDDDWLKSLSFSLENISDKNIKHAVIDIATVIFDDGLMWRAGRLMKRDPNNPRRWIPIDRLPQPSSYFNVDPAGKSPLKPTANFF